METVEHWRISHDRQVSLEEKHRTCRKTILSLVYITVSIGDYSVIGIHYRTCMETINQQVNSTVSTWRL